MKGYSLSRDIVLKILPFVRIHCPHVDATIIQRGWRRRPAAKVRALLRRDRELFLTLCGESDPDWFNPLIIPELIANRADWKEVLYAASDLDLAVHTEMLYRLRGGFATSDLQDILYIIDEIGVFNEAAWGGDEEVMLWLLDHDCDVDMLVYKDAVTDRYVERFESVDERLREKGHNVDF